MLRLASVIFWVSMLLGATAAALGEVFNSGIRPTNMCSTPFVTGIVFYTLCCTSLSKPLQEVRGC